MALEKSKVLLQKRRWRIRKKVKGTAERPRLVVTFSHQHIYAQCIDDRAGTTSVSVSTLNKDLKSQGIKPNLLGAEKIGTLLGEKAKAKGISQVVFDRAGRQYHGCVKVFSEAARSAGLIF